MSNQSGLVERYYHSFKEVCDPNGLLIQTLEQNKDLPSIEELVSLLLKGKYNINTVSIAATTEAILNNTAAYINQTKFSTSHTYFDPVLVLPSDSQLIIKHVLELCGFEEQTKQKIVDNLILFPNPTGYYFADYTPSRMFFFGVLAGTEEDGVLKGEYLYLVDNKLPSMQERGHYTLNLKKMSITTQFNGDLVIDRPVNSVKKTYKGGYIIARP